jgi:hypothetical protein
MSSTKEIIPKQKDHAFGKDVFLLGKDYEGIRYWLEAPSWDCGWYWGFGYVETYKGNRLPSKAKDINSHSHIDSGFRGKQEVYDTKKGAFVNTEYIHNIFDHPTLHKVTFTKEEGWVLSELFKQFYLLKEMAAFCSRTPAGCHLTSVDVGHGDLTAWGNKINQQHITVVTAKILEILSPKAKE